MRNFEQIHQDKVRELSPECMVLLKSNGDFPLKNVGKIALYGNGARRTLKGGRGSADVHVKEYTSVEKGLENAGFEITSSKWIDQYETAWQTYRPKFRTWLKEKIAKEGITRLMENLSIVMPEFEYEIPLDGEGDTAVYVLSRLCGEGVDRQNVKGDMFLTDTEVRDILALEKQYSKFMLVLNVGGIVDLSPIAEQVSNILLLSQLGSTTGDALADVLLGKAYPSGKLTATWAKESDYCKLGEFGHREDTRYKEGIYVGYRYFDSVKVSPIFPFGHGLGYTSFEITNPVISLDKTLVSAKVDVENTGLFKGKEVVQVYVSLPSVELAQPYQVLAAFAKTKELVPGEREEVVLSFDIRDLASSDVIRHEKVLESGNYVIRLGNSSRNTNVAAVIELDDRAVVEHIYSIGGETDFEDVKMDCQSTTEEVFEDVIHISLKATDVEKRIYDKPKLNTEALEIVKKLSDEELVYLLTGEFEGEGSTNIVGDSAITVVGAAGETTGRFQKYGVKNLVMSDGPCGLRIARLYGVDEKGSYPIEEENPLMEIEDKLGLLPELLLKQLLAVMPTLSEEKRNGEVHEQNCTAIPIATAIAQSFSTEVAKGFASIVSEELEHYGINIWLAPGLNIQRHPLCGRNFEYYSEDPLVSGKMAAAITMEIQKNPAQTVTIKHFIANNQEANRFRTSSMINERTLRDIYAKGFEIVVKEAQPHAIMSSYNLLNGVHTSERYDLLETLLREEWGYKGMVMSDYQGGQKESADDINKYRKFMSAESIKAGNDLMMPGGLAHYENILTALKGENETVSLSRDEVERCAVRNIELAWKLTGR